MIAKLIPYKNMFLQWITSTGGPETHQGGKLSGVENQNKVIKNKREKKNKKSLIHSGTEVKGLSCWWHVVAQYSKQFQQDQTLYNY